MDNAEHGDYDVAKTLTLVDGSTVDVRRAADPARLDRDLTVSWPTPATSSAQAWELLGATPLNLDTARAESARLFNTAALTKDSGPTSRLFLFWDDNPRAPRREHASAWVEWTFAPTPSFSLNVGTFDRKLLGDIISRTGTPAVRRDVGKLLDAMEDLVPTHRRYSDHVGRRPKVRPYVKETQLAPSVPSDTRRTSPASESGKARGPRRA